MNSDPKNFAARLERTFATKREVRAVLHATAVFLLLTFASSAAWAQGLPLTDCPRGSNGAKNYYLCPGDIVVTDGAASGIFLVDPTTGNQTPISTAVNAPIINGHPVNLLQQAASVTIEPGTGKLLASTRQYGIIRVDPKDGSQEVLLRGGVGWGPYPILSSGDPFIYPAGINIDPVDSSILVTDTGIRINACSDPNNVFTCNSDPGKIIRITKAPGSGAGVYSGNAVVAKGVLLSDPFDIAVDGNNGVASSIYVTDMNAKLGGAADPGLGGIIYLDANTNFNQSVFFSSYTQNPNATPPTSGTGCPMGITMVPPLTVNGTSYPTRVMATVWYSASNGYGCAPTAVLSLTPNVWLPTSPGSDFQTIFSGKPLVFPFGMDTDLNGRVIIADEGSGYGCKGTIFRLDLTKQIQTTDPPNWDGILDHLNPYALSPRVGLGCQPSGQANLINPSDAVVVKVAVTANIATPPTATITGAPGNSPEGTAITLGSAVTGSGVLTYAWAVAKTKNGTTNPSYATGSTENFAFLPDDDGTYAVSLSVTGDGGTASDSKTINVLNVPPAVGIMGIPVNTSEGTPINLTSTVSDPSPVDTASGFLGSWSVFKNGNPFASGSGPGFTFTPDHSGSYVVTLNVTDKDGGTGTAGTTINVGNIAPVITSFTGPTTPQILGSLTALTAKFTDAGAADTHTCTFTFGDTTTSAGTVTETGGSGSCTQTHTYPNAGVYSVGVTVTDEAGATASSVYNFVVIFDPTEGYVSGSGSIDSAAGSYVPDPSIKGRAQFGFHVKYNKRALVPSGTNTFKIKAPNFLFESTAFDWLVISGPSAQFKGSGTVNKTGSYGFLITITDGQQTGGGGVDKYRLKLTDNSTGQVVYDNVMGSPDDMATANPQTISSGKVIIFINTPPDVLTLALDQTTINEGGQVTLTGTLSDPDAGQSHTVTIDWGDGTTGTVSVSATTSNFAANHKYKDNPSSAPTYTINVTATDPLGATGTGSTAVTVNNLLPVVTNVTGPTAVVATGAAASITVNFTDPGVLDTHTCLFAFADGQTSLGTVTETNGSGSCKASYTYSSGGIYTVAISVTDKDSGSVPSTYKLTVNTPPEMTSLAPSSKAINEGGQTTVTGTFTDPDTSDTHTIKINWGDGSATTSISLVAGTLNFSATHLYKNNPAGVPSGPYSIDVTVADNHGGMGTGSTAVTVSNLPPVIKTISKPSPAVILGSAGNVKVNFTDAGTLDTHTCTFEFIDGQTSSGSITETNGSGSCAASYTYSAAGTYTVVVTITDKEQNGSVSSNFQIVVDTAPSALTLSLNPATINENDQTTLTGTFTDPDSDDTHKITINWGDGTSNTISLVAGVLQFSATHRYLDNPAGVPADGTFTINVTVADNWNGSAASNTSVTVNDAAPSITGQTSTVQTLPLWINFTDAGKQDTHWCKIAWGDDKTSSFPAYESAGSGACTSDHKYDIPGTYTTTVTVTDKDGVATTADFSVKSN